MVAGTITAQKQFDDDRSNKNAASHKYVITYILVGSAFAMVHCALSIRSLSPYPLETNTFH